MSAETRPRRQLADRTRRARTMSACALCPVLIHIGNAIGHLPGRGWAHIDPCILQALGVQRPATSSANDRNNQAGTAPGTH